MSKKRFVAFVTGKPDSGKSFVLARLAQKFPRRLVLDFLGEYEGAIPGAREAWSLGETVDALRAVAKAPRWTVVSAMRKHDMPALFDAIAPEAHGGPPGFSRAVGGMVLETGECDLVWPNGSTSDQAENLLRRGRHHWLSILAATQRPPDTDRMVTAFADIICAFRQHEPRDLAYLSGVMGGRSVIPLLSSLPAHTHLRYWTRNGALEIVAPDGSARPAFNLEGT